MTDNIKYFKYINGTSNIKHEYISHQFNQQILIKIKVNASTTYALISLLLCFHVSTILYYSSSGLS